MHRRLRKFNVTIYLHQSSEHLVIAPQTVLEVLAPQQRKVTSTCVQVKQHSLHLPALQEQKGVKFVTR